MRVLLVKASASAACSFGLAACGGGSIEVPFSPAPVNNGLPFAEAGQTLDDFTDQSADVTIVRHLLDYASGSPKIVVERGLLEVTRFDGSGPLPSVDPTMTIRIGGETLDFVDGRATDSKGKLWSAYIDTTGEVSGTAGFYHYDYGSGTSAFDTEGVFAFGFQTDPEELQARSLTAGYEGNWFGYGVVTDGADGIIANEAIGGGTLVLTADFDLMSIGGGLTGSYDSFGRVDGTIADVPIGGNSFAGGFDIDCGTGSSCTSNSIIGGAFFGQDGVEISGAIGFDERRSGSGETRRLVSSAGFTLFEQ